MGFFPYSSIQQQHFEKAVHSFSSIVLFVYIHKESSFDN